MPILEPAPTLAKLQQFVTQLEIERGFADQDIVDKCLMLGEEVGELFKAVRKRQNMTVDANSKFGSVGEELADIQIYLCAIANRAGIDLETAVREKEEINKTRVWRRPTE